MMNLTKYYWKKYYEKENGLISITEWVNFCKALTFKTMKDNKNILKNLKNR